MPLLAVDLSPQGTASLKRYAGVAFYLQADGLLATCKHIIQSLEPGETLVAKNLLTGDTERLIDTRCHPTADFALCRTLSPTTHDYFRHLDIEPALGTDVQALGFTAAGAEGRNLVVESRLFKGYISMSGKHPARPDARSTLAVSFPSLRVFRVAPVICGSGSALVGMLYSNLESTIELFKYEEVKDGAHRFSESVHRVLESGLVQPISDIRSFVDELGVTLQ